MKNNQKAKHYLPLASIFVAALLAHAPLAPHLLALMDADDATLAIMVRDIQAGYLTPFGKYQAYGGIAYTVVRAIWIAVWENFSRDTLLGHGWFTFGVTPILLAWAQWHLLSRAFSRNVAWAAGLVAALGSRFWMNELIERDFYVAYVVLGYWLVAKIFEWGPFWRSQGRQIEIRWTVKQQAAFALVSGFGAYLCRASLIFTAVGLLSGLGDVMKSAKDIRTFTRSLDTNFRRRGLINLGYFILGASPELWARLMLRQHPPALASRFSDASTIGTLFKELPEIAKTIFTHSESRLAYASLAVAAIAWALTVLTRKKRASHSLALQIIALNIAAYFWITQTGIGVPRYFLPSSVAITLTMGFVLETVFELWKRRSFLAAAGLSGLIALSVTDNLAARWDFIARARASSLPAENKRVAQVFSSLSVPLVLTDDYWETNQHTVLTRANPPFISDGRVLGDIRAFEIAPFVNHAGLILTRLTRDQTCENVRETLLLKRRWRLKFLERIGNRCLYEGWEIARP